MFNDNDEDYNLYPIKYQQYQSFSSKILLTLDEYLERVRLDLIKMSKNCKLKLTVNTVFKSIRNSNDKRTLQIKSSANINEIFDQLIKKHHDLTESLKNVDLIPEGIESITYNFTKIIITDTFIESPEWIQNKKCAINPQNKDNKRFQYSVTIALNHQKIKNNPERIPKIKPFIDQYNWNNINFPPQQQDYKTFQMNN